MLQPCGWEGWWKPVSSVSNREDWRPWEEGLQALRLRDCCAAADAFYEAVRLDLDGLWEEAGPDPVAYAVRDAADLMASVLEAHGDTNGALDLLEFAYQAGRRDAELIIPYLTLLLAGGEWAAATPVLDEASRHEPHRPEYAAIRRRLRAHRSTSASSHPSSAPATRRGRRALTYVKGRNTDAQARSPRRAEARTP